MSGVEVRAFDIRLLSPEGTKWRRVKDLNLRTPFGVTRFRGARFQPLSQLSKIFEENFGSETTLFYILVEQPQKNLTRYLTNLLLNRPILHIKQLLK